MATATNQVYELRERPLLRCLLSPFENGGVLTAFLGALGFLFAGGWITAGAALYVVVFEVMSYRIRLRADESGIVVTNRFFRHRIPWGLISTVSSSDRTWPVFLPTVEITPGKASLSVSVRATMGMSRARRREVALELVDLARQYGHEILGGSLAELDAQLRAKERTQLETGKFT
jgi:Bacterial PH domain